MHKDPADLIPRECYYCAGEIIWEHYPDEYEHTGCRGGWGGYCERCQCGYTADQSGEDVESDPTPTTLDHFTKIVRDLWRVLPVTWRNQIIDELGTTRHIALDALRQAVEHDPGRVTREERAYLETAEEVAS